jgi:hypothetical protein
MVRFIKSNGFVAAVLGELVAPAGRSEGAAVDLMAEYLLGDTGREHFYSLHPGVDEGEYYEALYQLYELQEAGSREESLSGASDTGCNQCHSEVVLN